MRERTRAVLLWLAGLGGAAVVAKTLLDALTALVGGLYYAGATGLLVLLIAAATVALVAVRSRLAAEPPVSFSETRP